jgi:hypothetical protein
LWVNDWHDGPLEAVVEHGGNHCLMVLHRVDTTNESYEWLVIRLTEPQRADEEKWHALYVEHVGEHWCFHGATIAHFTPTREPDPDAFFDAYRERPPLDLSNNPVVGWADEMPAR